MERRRWIAGGVILVAAIAVALFLFLARGQEHTAMVVEVVNTVDAHPRPKDEWLPAAVDMVIHTGGQVRTWAESSARIELLEGLVRLSEDSIFTFKESVTRHGILVTTLSLQEGRLWAHLTSDQPHEFTVETSSAVAAVRDTSFSVRVADGETLVSVAKGEVELTAQEQRVTVGVEEQATVEPGQPPSAPEPLSTEERRMWATEGEVPELAPPIGEAHSGMGGNLSIRGVVRDSLGNVAPDVYIEMTVYREGGGGDAGVLWRGDLLTDETGAYAFNGLLRVAGGHYEVWLSSRQEYGGVYEKSGYYIDESQTSGDTYLLDVTVFPITGSALSSVIQYEDADGVIRSFISDPPAPDPFIELDRGTGDNNVYAIDSQHFTDDGSGVYHSNLAGGTYYLVFQYTRPDGVRVGCDSPSFEIPPGEILQFEYTIPWSCWDR
jgi:hypothetical protein